MPRIKPPILTVAACLTATTLTPAPACCPAPPPGMSVVNADQTIVILWDAATKTEHFIRRASFKSTADDFGFLIPTPTQPELSESGGAAFPYLAELTAPAIEYVERPSGGCGCSALPKSGSVEDADEASVTVLEEKTVAGFDAAVLEADSAGALVDWLEERGYAFSPEIEAWAKPYVEQGWKITAFKVAKPKADEAEEDEFGPPKEDVNAAALRMTFQTPEPIFPYREPDPTAAAAALGAKERLLRIYFLSDARYWGKLTEAEPWTGKVVWSDRLGDTSRHRLLTLLGLPTHLGLQKLWLTEFEDDWPYRPAPADLTFARNENQGKVRRDPIIEYVSRPPDLSALAIAGLIALPPILRRVRRRSRVG